MQNILTVEINGEKIVSKIFDFETMCIVNDAHNTQELKGPLRICRDAVSYMFEGTVVTDDVLAELSVQKMTSLCLKTWEFYIKALSEKNV